MAFPIHRMRRLRQNEKIRSLVRETRLSVEQLIYPIFVTFGKGIKSEIKSMPGNYRFSTDLLMQEIEELLKLGINSIILFGIPQSKDAVGSEAYNPKGIIQETIREIKGRFPELIVITDVCIDEYTDHGHCGLIKDGEILNDETLDLLAKMALTHAEAGADIVAPSDMMDGRVGAIRERLDEFGFSNIPIMAYSAKYASAFYGPFREAADSAPKFGDRKTYQMDLANGNEALREVELDFEEGADILMVKPALSYLDIIYRVKEEFRLPVAAYNVSGEYSMVVAAARNDWIERERMVMEILLSIRRAGADMILTYHAKEAAIMLAKD